MTQDRIITVDVAVVGGGPAGLSACLELARSQGAKVALFESETELGGMPRSCHVFFGMRDLKRIYNGPTYAKKLDRLVRKTKTDIYTNATVIQIVPRGDGSRHVLKVVTKEGLIQCLCKCVLLATGCFERSRESRRIPGSRPAGVFTTGSLQQVVNLQGSKPGNRALIIGSEHVSLSAALTLKSAGTTIAGMVSDDSYPHTYPIVAKVIGTALGFPILKNFSVSAILGKTRVEAVELECRKTGKHLQMACDTVVCTGKFRPDAALIYKTAIREDSASMGPEVDMSMMTSEEGIFAAGNVLRGADMHDICALEGRRVAQNIIKKIKMKNNTENEIVKIRAAAPIRYIVPQILSKSRISNWKTSFFKPGVSIQLSRTMKKVRLEALSGGNIIWSRKYTRIIGNNRIQIPVENFQWGKIDFSEGIFLRVADI